MPHPLPHDLWTEVSKEKDYGLRHAKGRGRKAQLWHVTRLPELASVASEAPCSTTSQLRVKWGHKGDTSSPQWSDCLKSPTPPPSTSRSVEQSTTALPGSALKTLKSWTLLKECIVLLDSLDGPERKQPCWFRLCC